MLNCQHLVDYVQLAELAKGESASVICPRGCEHHAFITQVEAVVWGTKTYTPDSFICMAAKHATGKDGKFQFANYVK